jgi:ABC-type nitrate/sulfonate/bicarbonate transport system substrate-binding protein
MKSKTCRVPNEFASKATPVRFTPKNRLKVILFSVALLLSSSQAPAQEHATLMVSYAAVNANMLNLWVAKEAGYFRDEGIDAGLILVRGGSLAVQLLLSGQAPMSLVGATPIANAYLQGNKDLVMIAGVTNIMSYVLAAKPEIQSSENIKGSVL